jgi:hypothetical protein
MLQVIDNHVGKGVDFPVPLFPLHTYAGDDHLFHAKYLFTILCTVFAKDLLARVLPEATKKKLASFSGPPNSVFLSNVDF